MAGIDLLAEAGAKKFSGGFRSGGWDASQSPNFNTWRPMSGNYNIWYARKFPNRKDLPVFQARLVSVAETNAAALAGKLEDQAQGLCAARRQEHTQPAGARAGGAVALS
jgi:hypothetical protein